MYPNKKQEIKELLLKGKTYSTIATMTGLSQSTIRRTKNDFKDEFMELINQHNQPAILENLLNEFYLDFEKAKMDLENLRLKSTNPNVKLGCINSQIKLIESKISILQGLCLLPKPQEHISLEVTKAQQYNFINVEKYVEKLKAEEIRLLKGAERNDRN